MFQQTCTKIGNFIKTGVLNIMVPLRVFKINIFLILTMFCLQTYWLKTMQFPKLYISQHITDIPVSMYFCDVSLQHQELFSKW